MPKYRRVVPAWTSTAAFGHLFGGGLKSASGRRFELFARTTSIHGRQGLDRFIVFSLSFVMTRVAVREPPDWTCFVLNSMESVQGRVGRYQPEISHFDPWKDVPDRLR